MTETPPQNLVPPQSGAASRTQQTSRALRLLQSLGIYLALGVLFCVGLSISPEKFLDTKNLMSVLQAVTLLGIVSVGVSFITYGGHYVDLSIPRMIALSGFASVAALPWGLGVSLLCGLAAGLSVGLINGFIVGYLRLNPIIWTLAMSFILEGATRWYFQGNQIYPDGSSPAGAQFLNLSQATLGGLPYAAVLLIVLAAAGLWLMKATRFGAHVRLTGSAYEVARLSGVRVRLIVLLTYLLSSFTTALAGIFLTSLNRQAAFETGEGYDFNAVTAVVLGGVMLSGGRGSILGVIGGVLVIGFLTNIMNLAGVGDFVQLIVRGTVFITVVGATSWFWRKSGREDV